MMKDKTNSNYYATMSYHIWTTINYTAWLHIFGWLNHSNFGTTHLLVHSVGYVHASLLKCVCVSCGILQVAPQISDAWWQPLCTDWLMIVMNAMLRRISQSHFATTAHIYIIYDYFVFSESKLLHKIRSWCHHIQTYEPF